MLRITLALLVWTATVAFAGDVNDFTVPGLRFLGADQDFFQHAPLPLPDGLSHVQVYSRDFTWFEGKLNANVSDADIEGGWRYDVVEAGAGEGAVTLVASTGGPFGALNLLSDAGASDTITMEQQGEPWKLASGKAMWFLAKMKTDTVAKTLFLVGLATGLTSNDAFNATAPTDGIWFEKKTAANTDVDFHVRKSGTSTSTTSACGVAWTDDTYMIVGWRVSTGGGIEAYCGATYATLARVASVASGAANIPTAALHTVIATKNGEAVAHGITLDDLYTAQER